MSQRWSYSDAMQKERRDRLLSIESFATIADSIRREMSVLCYHVQTCDNDLTYSRPIFCVRVRDHLFDAFFNSPEGYRGMYFESPYRGLECNQFLMECVFARLSQWALENSPGYNAQFSQDALLAVSSKAWLAECSTELCSSCEGEWTRPTDNLAEILNGRWESSSKPDSRFGRKAPKGSKLRFFGAFLDGRGDEFIPVRKRARHQQIHCLGWS
jgi:hypothetical protein